MNVPLGLRFYLIASDVSELVDSDEPVEVRPQHDTLSFAWWLQDPDLKNESHFKTVSMSFWFTYDKLESKLNTATIQYLDSSLALKLHKQ